VTIGCSRSARTAVACRDPHTVGGWPVAFRRDGPAARVQTHGALCFASRAHHTAAVTQRSSTALGRSVAALVAARADAIKPQAVREAT